MEDRPTVVPGQAGEAVDSRFRRDLAPLAILLVLAAGVHAWLVTHTTVAARDSIGYVRYALQLEHQPWGAVVRQQEQHPVYPLTILAVSRPVRHFQGGTTAAAMQLSSQLASALAGVLLVFPMFYLGKLLFDRTVGFWAAALFQCLPASARITSDGLSEATFLLLSACTLLLAVIALRRRSLLGFAGCGLCGGLAFLTRPEGIFTVAATGLVLLGTQLVPAWRQRWRRTLEFGVNLAMGALLLVGPYVAVTGHLTNKPTPRTMLGTQPMTPGPTGAAPAPSTSLFAVWQSPDEDTGQSRAWWALKAIASEGVQGFHYVAWVPALLGLWWGRSRFRTDPGAWVLPALCLIHAVVLWRMAVVIGYVSERHVQLFVFCGVFWAAAGAREIPARAMGIYQWIKASGGRQTPDHASHQGADAPRSPRLRWAQFAVLAALVGFGLPRALLPLHTNRAGHREAGQWLAAQAHPADVIVDPFCWAHYYAGRVFLEGTVPDAPPGYRPRTFVVIENSSNAHPRLPLMGVARDLAQHGTLVYQWTPTRSTRHRRAEEVQVYCLVPPSPP